MRSFLLFLAALGALTLASRPAQAGFVYQFDSGGSPTTAFTSTVGGTVAIQVYLVETDNNGTLAAQGLFSAGAKLTSGTSSVANVASAGNIAPNAGFANNYSSVTGAVATLQADNLGNNNIVYPAAGDPDRILLGTFTFTALSSGSTTITVNNISPYLSNNVTGSGNDLTPLIVDGQTATITVTAVPEPSAFVLAGLLASGVAGGAWRRYRRQKVHPLLG